MDDSTKRITQQKQTLDEAYSPPANYLEISVNDPVTHGEGRTRFTDFRMEMKTNMPVFKLREVSVRRRYSEFKWLRDEVTRTVQINVPSLPGKAITKQLPFLKNDDGKFEFLLRKYNFVTSKKLWLTGIFEEEFIEERRVGLEDFVNKVAGHPLVQGERCLHMFLTEPELDLSNYVPGKVSFSM